MRKTVNAEKNLTEGKILKTMLIFAFPMIMMLGSKVPIVP